MELELPDDLLIEILLLLPVKSLLRFKCVSKHWLSLIQSPSFVDRHRHFSITTSTKLLCVRKDPITETHVISVLDRHTLERLEDLEWPPFLEEKGFEHIELPDFIVFSAGDKGVECPEDCIRRIKIFGPVNGIYCIHRSLVDKWVGTLTLWNPATREYKHIHPQVSFPFSMELLGFRSYDFYHQQEAKSLHIGFGSDRSNNDFKVVVICQWQDIDTAMEQHWHLRVYNHASDTWRTVYYLNHYEDPHPLFEGAYPPFPQMHGDPPVSDGLLNGVVHWACSLIRHCVDYNQYNVLAFDMTTDAMQLMKGPPFPTHLGVMWSVWVLNETIAAVSYGVDSPLEVWVMMEYGAETSWARFYSLPGVTDWDPVGISYDGRMFFDDQNGQLISLGIFDEDQHVKEHDIYGMPDYVVCGSLEILNLVETLTTLKPE